MTGPDPATAGTPDNAADAQHDVAVVADTPHSAFRREVRQAALQAATEQLNAAGWDSLTVSAIAETVGVSRPTIYAEFGNKDGLAEALIMLEAERFLSGIADILQRQAAEPIAAIESAIRFTLEETENSAVLRAIWTSGASADSGNESLLPFITTRSERIVALVNQQLSQWFRTHCPETSDEQLTETIDTLVRLVLSHMVQPSSRPERVPTRISSLVALLLPELDR